MPEVLSDVRCATRMLVEKTSANENPGRLLKIEIFSLRDVEKIETKNAHNLTLNVNTFTGKLRSDCMTCTVVLLLLGSDFIQHSFWQLCVVAVAANSGGDSQLT